MPNNRRSTKRRHKLNRTGASAVLVLGISILLIGQGSASAAPLCPNAGLRTGPSALLPSCRAYELVTPPDSNGHMVGAIATFGFGAPYDLFPAELASPTRASIVYMAYTSPLEDPKEPTGVFDVYRADRSAAGWKTVSRLTPSGPEAVFPTPGGISSDHSYAFVDIEPVQSGALPAGSLSSAGITDYLGKPDGSFEYTGKGSIATEPYAQGRYITEGGGHIIFTTGHDQPTQSSWCSSGGSDCKVLQLESDAPPAGTGAVYDRSADGPTHVVSLLPNDVTPPAGAQAFYKGTSKDASSIAFEIGGTLYVRIHNGVEGEQATLKVAEGEPAYAGLSDDGRYLFYVAGGDKGTIHRFDTSSKVDVEVNAATPGEIVNVSDEGSHVYFVSEGEIGGEGNVGEPNLFVWRNGATHYIATVAASDLVRTSGTLEGIPALTRWTSYAVSPRKDVPRGPGADSSRVTPDGKVFVFESKAKLTFYDSGGHTEIYRYDDNDSSITCVSCNPLAEPATSDAQLQELNLVSVQIAVNNVNDAGTAVLFETSEALVGRDTDGVNDIYEWQGGVGGDTSELVSSGQSTEYQSLVKRPGLPSPNVLLSVTPSGSDVVFLSQDQLVPAAGIGGVPAIYDARIGGGFAEFFPSPSCVEEGCRPLGPAPIHIDSTVQSERPSGSGNVKPKRRNCSHRAKKHRKHHHCRDGKPKKGNARTAAVDGAPTVDRQREIQRTDSAIDPWGGFAAPRSVPALAAAAEFNEFGIEEVGAEETATTAASHPDFTNLLTLNHFLNKAGNPEASARVENVRVQLPAGLLGNPRAVPQCKTGELIAFGHCPIESQVGIAKVRPMGFGELTEPIYNLEPPHPEKEIARFGLIGYLYPIFINVELRTAGDFGATAIVQGAPGLAPLIEAKTTFWANPSDPAHDGERLTAIEAIECGGTACKAPGGKREVPRTGPAFMTNPSACQEGSVNFAVTSYQLPGKVFEASAPMQPITNCQGLPFAPTFSAEPTSHVAGAPTGLKTKLVLPQHLGAEEPATATMREARVTLPAGMQVAAGAANWIGTCSAAQVGYHEEVDAKCPDNSKLGTATITSPALPAPIEGSIYQRTPTPGHQLGLWLVVDALGLHVKLPGELEPDKATGRLATVFHDLPQTPVEEIDLNVWGGPRAPLQNPDHCGTFATDFSFAPHSNDPAVTGHSQMTINQGCNQPFDPKISVGVTNPVAGKFSPLVVDLTREDGNQGLRGFEITLPDGEVAKLKGVPLCPEAAASAASCPATSAIGHVVAASGPGPEPLWVPQPGKPEPKVYLAGPYGGSPFSVVTEVPAQAGPFDLGTLAVRSGLGLDPETNRAVVKADPLPQFFEGVGLSYRRVHAVIDRPEFSLNPTDCSQLQTTSNVTSTLGTVAHPTSPFGLEGCKALGFKPKLSLKLAGGTKRGSYPALTAVLKARKGDANIAKTSVGLPHSEFLAQEHIVTVCTRKQFAADKCPKGSIYGKAKAWTPLLAKPLSGPVYLRSSSHPLPDLVMAFGGELDVNIVGRIDSKNGGIRANFDSVPDAPISKFVMQMNGGKKSLLVNSTDICVGKHRATVRMSAQNGRELSFRAELKAQGCGSGGG